MNQEVKINVKREGDKKIWFKEVSKFEKYFWVTIICLVVIFIFLNVLAFVNTKIEDVSAQNNISIFGDL